MKFYSIIFFLLVVVMSCKDDRAPSGINGTVLYGEGDCAITGSQNNRIYEPFSGKVWVVEKSILDTMNIIQFDTTNSSMFYTYASTGQFALMLPPGTFYIVLDTLFYISPENCVTLKPDDLIEREFRFYKCI